MNVPEACLGGLTPDRRVVGLSTVATLQGGPTLRGELRKLWGDTRGPIMHARRLATMLSTRCSVQATDDWFMSATHRVGLL